MQFKLSLAGAVAVIRKGNLDIVECEQGLWLLLIGEFFQLPANKKSLAPLNRQLG